MSQLHQRPMIRMIESNKVSYLAKLHVRLRGNWPIACNRDLECAQNQVSSLLYNVILV
jgi:hypothetical protein